MKAQKHDIMTVRGQRFCDKSILTKVSGEARYGGRNGVVAMLLDQGDIVQMALVVIVVAVLIVIVLPYFSGRRRR